MPTRPSPQRSPRALQARLASLAYSLLWALALPLVVARLAWRARKQPAYLHHLGERFGRYAAPPAAPLIWVHAVSVGETRAAEPLVRALLARWPQHDVLLTHMTPTGRATAQQLFDAEPRVRSVYLPYDLAWLAARFLCHFRPRFGVIMETELWPNLLATAARSGVPVVLANARLSARSAGRYARFPLLSRMTLGALAATGAQTAADAERLQALGATGVSVTGNIKFDIEAPAAALALGAAFRARCGERPVVMAASTREGEEAALLDAFARMASPEALLLLVPRHPQRFDEVAALASERGLALQRRSDGQVVARTTRVWLGDSMGEMFAYYAAADVALIGGSWLPFGGQNPIEACAVGTPVVLGPHTFNFEWVADAAVTAGAALREPDAAAGMARALELLADRPRRAALADAGRGFAAAHRGATARTLDLLQQADAARP
ncbi:lipid IV(A) 3-deoxy-D-manno-octulosonic acid transferase [Azoarcus olearius]|uniref:lipid IV(A) 3-deoxy-D-manno-octulosonic acid transferase n=1 Tax=Azoarcus sp. (strain BH72) TaxID=418699 RepID=UPI000806EDB7|nr:lipid IV(A) 3-deoxy-D-manno-octulosonic acid transferase [Azoarcus olearius]